jgi:DNA-binding NarL/FixJ family response regulator
MQNIRVLIYSPSYIIRKGLASIVEKIQGIKNIVLQDQTDELLEIMNYSEFDFVMLDSDINQQKKLFEKIKVKYNNEQLITINNHSEHELASSDLKNNIHISDSQADILEKLTDVIGNTSKLKSNSKIPEEISKREADILKYIALGFSNKETADKLFISAHTVVTHRKNITRKLGIKTAPGLTIYAILNNIIDINDTEKV